MTGAERALLKEIDERGIADRSTRAGADVAWLLALVRTLDAALLNARNAALEEAAALVQQWVDDDGGIWLYDAIKQLKRDASYKE